MPPRVPPPVPRLRPDGTVRGPSRRWSLSVLGAGLALLVVGCVVAIPPLFDSINGPRFEIPGARTIELDTGSWTIYQLTGTSRGAGGGGFGGVTITEDRGITVRPENVSISGPAPAAVREQGFGTETISRDGRTYTGAVRFQVAEAGSYTVAVGGEGGEVLIARPFVHLFSRWPWLIAAALGALLAVAGLAMWLVGAANRRVARRAGIAG